jgi:hypothetical protein
MSEKRLDFIDLQATVSFWWRLPAQQIKFGGDFCREA